MVSTVPPGVGRQDQEGRMPIVWKDFDSYSFWYVSDSGFAGTVNAAQIECYKAGAFIGRLNFIKEGETLPANDVIGGYPYVYYHLSSFRDVIATLRYDKPLVLYVDSDSHVGAIGTGTEPVGEQEA
jgi:hypothetical protein